MINIEVIIVVNLNVMLYREIVGSIIDKELNKLEAKDELANILNEYSIRKEIHDPRKHNLKYNITMFLQDRERQGASPLTIDGYGRHLNIFANMVDKKVQDITKEDILQFLDVRGEGRQLTTLETIRSILRVFFCWLEDEEIIVDNPMLKIRPYRLPRAMTRALTVEQLEIVRESCKTIREKTLVETLYSTGCRLEEVTRINVGCRKRRVVHTIREAGAGPGVKKGYCGKEVANC